MEDIFSMRDLLLKWVNGKVDDGELARLIKWAEESEENKTLMANLKDNVWVAKELDRISKVDTEIHWKKLQSKLNRNI